MNANPRKLTETANLSYPPVGVYDVPETHLFGPATPPGHCIFDHFQNWMRGECTVIGPDAAPSFGCPGAAYWLCSVSSVPPESVSEYLVHGEGLKASTEVMDRWNANHPPYRMEHTSVVISRLVEAYREHLKTVTFWVNADQLALLLTGAEYHNGAANADPVTIRYGSGCGQLLPMLTDLDRPAATVGALDIAMRKHLPPDLLAFTVTKPMYDKLCSLDDDSFLGGTFWKEVSEARKGAAPGGAE